MKLSFAAKKPKGKVLLISMCCVMFRLARARAVVTAIIVDSRTGAWMQRAPTGVGDLGGSVCVPDRAYQAYLGNGGGAERVPVVLRG